MKVSVEEVNQVKKRVSVAIPREQVAKELTEYFIDVRKRANIKGFRPGKAPMGMIERMYRDAATADVSSKLIGESYPKAVEEQNLKPLGTPTLEKGTLAKDQDFSYTATVEVKPEFKVDGYFGLELEKEEIQVTDDQVEDYLRRVQEAHSRLEPVADRALREGDVAIVDYERFIDEQPVEESKHENVHIELGKNRFPELEKGLVGHSKDDQKDVVITYPEDHELKSVAGKTVKYSLKVVDIKEKVLPELDDDFAKELDAEADTVEELRKKIREDLTQRENQRVQTVLNSQIIKRLIETHSFEVPEVLVEYELSSLVENFQRRLVQQGITLEAAGIDLDEWRKSNVSVAEERVRASLLLNAVGSKEGIEVSDEELDEGYRKVAKQMGQDKEFIKGVYQKNNMVDTFKDQLLEEKILKAICDHATFISKPPEPTDSEKEGTID
ncbi:MAG: trigger factor [Deltaproteobacteria bacterium]|nr:trigger factor [Deltaproteobacteria bacterium]